MKQSMQKLKRKQPIAVNKKQHPFVSYSSVVAGKSNHTQVANDKWERQANEAAKRVMCGEERVSRHLTPVLAANKKIKSSLPEPLPLEIRKTLEISFGVDLSNVRIHRDTAAIHAARSEKARAFTAGLDIYFGSRQFNPGSEKGFRLLVHELSHVIQQTARPGFGGVVSLHDVVGHGSIQMEQETASKDHADGSLVVLAFAIIEDHIKDDPKLQNKLDNWLPEFLRNSYDMDVPIIKKFIEDKVDKTSDKGELGFLLDLSRLFSKAELPAKVIRKNPYVRTICLDNNVLEYLLNEETKNWWIQSLTKTHIGKLFWPDGFKNAIREYLWETQRKSKVFNIKPNKNGMGSLSDYKRQAKQKKNYDGLLRDNEWVYGALLALCEMEYSLREKFYNIDKSGEQNKIDNLYKRQIFKVEELQHSAQYMLDFPKKNSYWWAWKELGRITKDEIESFEKYINISKEDIKVHDKMFSEWDTPITSKDTHPLIKYINSLPDFPKLLSPAGVALFDAAIDFFILEPGDRKNRYSKLPDKAKAFIYKTNEVANDFTIKAIKMLVESKTKFGPERETVEKTGQALLFFAGLISEYGTKTGVMTKKALENIKDDDHRIDIIISNRYDRARELKEIATVLNGSHNSWSEIISLTDKVTKGIFIQTSALAIIHPFKVDKDADVSLIPKDIGKNIKNFEPFTPNDLMIFYNTNILKVQNDILRSILKINEMYAIKDTRTIYDLFILNEAESEMKKKLDIRPHRWVSPHAYWIKYSSDPDTQFGISLRQHTKFKDLHIQEKDKKRELLYSMYSLSNDSSVVIWSMPFLTDLIKNLRRIKLLNAIVYLNRARDPFLDEPQKKDDQGKKKLSSVDKNEQVLKKAQKVTENEVKTINSLDDWEWYTFLAYTKDLLFSKKTPIHEEISKIINELHQDHKKTVADYKGLQRRATNMDREVFSTTDKNSIKNLLSQCGSEQISSYKYLRDVLKILKIFGNNIAPREEYEFQMSAIMLENGTQLLEKLKNVNYYYIISQFYPYISKALSFADKTLNKGNILKGSGKEQVETKNNGQKALLTLKKKMIESLIYFQEKFGIQVDKNSQTLTSLMQKSFPIKAGAPMFDEDGKKLEDSPEGPFIIDGLKIQVKKVFHSFTFFPRVGDKTSDHSLYRPAKLYMDKIIDSPKEVDDKEVDEIGAIKQQSIKLVKVALYDSESNVSDSDSTVFDITSKDLENPQSGLHWLAHVVSMRSIAKNMENLQEVIDFFGEGLLFALSFTPAGVAVDLAMLIGMVAKAFSNDPDSIKSQLDTFFNEPKEIFETLENAINESLNPEKLLKIFLLGENHYKDLITEKIENRPNTIKKKRNTNRNTKIAQALKGVRNLGTSLAVQVMKLQGKVQNKVSAVQGTVISQPILSAILMWIADNWENVDNPESVILEHPVLGPIYEMYMVLDSNISSSNNDLAFDETAFAKTINDMLQQITELELPQEVIPNDQIVNILLVSFLDFVSSRAKGKIKIVTKIINSASESLGVKDALAEALANKMKGSGFDPNTYWLENFLPVIERPFNDALSTLYSNITYIMEKAPILKKLKGQDLIKNQTVSITTSNELNEVYSSDASILNDEISPFPGSSPIDIGYKLEPVRGGRPLSKELRNKNESLFGHDFGHVRLHTDASADKRTRSLGANALTMGSHIFLRSGMTPHYGDGSKILRHELSHVLQKSGPRPLLSGNSSTHPVAQRGKTSIRNIYNEELGADSMADRALSTYYKGPVPIIGLHQNGVSPNKSKKSEAIIEFIKSVSDVKTAKEEYKNQYKKEHVDKYVKRNKKDKVTNGIVDRAKELWKVINTKIANGKVTFNSFWIKRKKGNQPLSYIKTALKDTSSEATMPKVVTLLALKNQTEGQQDKNKKKNNKGRSKTKKMKELNEPDFLKSLELYLLKRTGILITFEYTKKKQGKTESVNLNKVVIGDIHLWWIDSSKQPWIDVINNTWGNKKGKQKTKLKKGAKEATKNEEDKPESKLFYKSKPIFNVWSKTKYKFSDEFAKKIEYSIKPKKLKATNLPPWKEFIITDDNELKKPGVKLTTHEKFKELSVIGRQSHHTTQFLLAEYFHNEKTFKPFPTDNGRKWPGVKFKNRKVESIKNDDNDEIKVEQTYASRGGKMPAISLSSETHLGAGLHITPRGDENISSSQGYAVHKYFNENMPKELKQNQETEKHKKNVKNNSNNEGNKIYEAVQKTYNVIRIEMQKKFKDKFPESEVDYYANIAGDSLEDKTKDINGKNKEGQMVQNLKDVADKAEKKNKDTLEILGWIAQ